MSYFKIHGITCGVWYFLIARRDMGPVVYVKGKAIPVTGHEGP
jgi:hypothetical protein